MGSAEKLFILKYGLIHHNSKLCKCTILKETNTLIYFLLLCSRVTHITFSIRITHPLRNIHRLIFT